MIVFKNYVTFKVMGKEINLFSEDFSYGQSTVAEINDHFYYLGNEGPSLSSAIFAWQEVNGRDLTGPELHQVLVDNKLVEASI